MQPDGPAQNTAPVVFHSQVEGLRQLPGSIRDLDFGSRCRQLAKRAHAFDSDEWLDGSQQNRGARSGAIADHVGADVDSVAPVHVEAAGWAEHDLVARGDSAVRMGARIAAVARIGLDFHDPPDQTGSVLEAPNQVGAQQRRRDRQAMLREEPS